jgi:DNA polymerase-1
MTLTGLGIDYPQWLKLVEQKQEDLDRLDQELADLLARYLDQVQLATLLTDISKNKAKRKKLTRMLEDGIPIKVEWGGPVQLKAVLNALGVKVNDCEDKTLARHYDDHQINKYGSTWGKFVNPVTGRIHADFKQLGARTGHFSVGNPPLQGMPRDGGYRDCIVAAAGERLLIADWSQVEVRIVAEISQDHTMMQIFQESKDLHTTVARRLLGLRGNVEVTSEQRRLSKAVVFGLIYGMTANTLVTHARDNFQVEMTLDEAEKFVKVFFKMFPGLHKWQEQERKRADRTTRCETRTVLGRRRYVSYAQDGYHMYSQILNSPVQVSGADALKIAIALMEETKHAVPGAELVMVVHDEVITQVPAHLVEEGKAWVADCMNRGLIEGALKIVPPGISPREIADSDHWVKP